MKKIIFTILALMILSACEPKQYYYVGEGENWRFQVNTTGLEKDNRSDWRLQYIGKGSYPETLNYEIRDLSFSQVDPPKATGIQLNENGMYTQESSTLCQQCRNTKEQQEFEVRIEWEEQSEILKVIFDKSLN